MCNHRIGGSVFKLALLAVGVLVLLPDRVNRREGLITLGLIVLCAAAMSVVLNTSASMQFVSHLQEIAQIPWDVGTINPASFTFIKAIRETLANDAGLRIPEFMEIVVYCGWVGIAMLIGLSSVGLLDFTNVYHKKFVINVACLMYALTIPRFKDYSYIIIIPAAYFIVNNLHRIPPSHLLFILCILSAAFVPMPGLHVAASILWSYFPLMLALLLFVIYVVELQDVPPSSTYRSSENM